MIRRWVDFISYIYIKEFGIDESMGEYCFKLRDTFGLSKIRAHAQMSEAYAEIIKTLRRKILSILLWESENLDPRTLVNV
jgi:hypothetical protein